jgi:hypothetical protein
MEKHIIHSEKIERDGFIYWRLFMYYPADGVVKVYEAPQKEIVPQEESHDIEDFGPEPQEEVTTLE